LICNGIFRLSTKIAALYQYYQFEKERTLDNTFEAKIFRNEGKEAGREGR